MLLFRGMNKRLLPLILFAIAVTSLFSVQPAQAYTVTLNQVGANVVAIGNGPIDLAGLTLEFENGSGSQIDASIGVIIMDPSANLFDVYSGFTGPASFGSGGLFTPNAASGDDVGIAVFQGLLGVPGGYVSNTALSDSMTFNNESLASMGLTPGTYVWTWGDGGANERFTLIIGRGQGVPDGGTTISLLGCALLGLAALRRKLGC